MNDPRERIRGLFDSVADTYDQVGVDFFGPIAQGLVAELDPRPGERALDLGCGRGAALLRIARAVGLSGRAFGGDIAPRMVEQCRALAAAEGLSQVVVREIDAQDPVLPGNRMDDMDDLDAVASAAAVDPAASLPDDDWSAVDLIASSLVVFFLPEPATALRRWLPLLRPGGRVGISTFADQDPAWARVEEVFRPYLPPQLLDPRTSGRSGPFASDDGVEGLLEQAGFIDVCTTRLPLEVRFTDPEQWYRFSMSVGQRAFWAAVPEGERGGVKAEAQRRLVQGATSHGSLAFGQDVRYTMGRRPAS